MTVKDQKGKVLFTKTKEYEVYDLHLPSNKGGYLGFDDWDLTAMTHIVENALEPFETDSEIYVALLKEDTKSVDIEVSFSYLYEEGGSAVISKVNKTVEFGK
ncbi:MAG: hypothetical protein HZC48_12925 [Nitrospirae bacterium]|nr:hypothetical protein [Nitrospirota bacterium]